MSAPLLLAVGLAGGVGALGRHVVGVAVSLHFREPFPLGTFVINITGTFALGLLTGLAPSTDVSRLLGLGLLGGFTTFSTWMLESERLAAEWRTPVAVTNIVASLFVGLLAVWLGRELGQVL